MKGSGRQRHRTNICGERIDYEIPDKTPLQDKSKYCEAVLNLEDALAVIAEMQERRKNEEGDICEPISPTLFHTVLEMKREYIDSALVVLEVWGCPSE